MGGPVTDRVLGAYNQDTAFTKAQRAARSAHPQEAFAIEQAAETEGRERGSFTADDVMDRVGREFVPPNLIGSVLGSLRSAGRIRVTGREKSRHRAAKGRWVNRFEFTGQGDST